MNNEIQKRWNKFQLHSIDLLERINKQNFVGIGINPSFDKSERLFISKRKDRFVWNYCSWDKIYDYNRIDSNRIDDLKLKFEKLEPTLLRLEGDLDNEIAKKLETYITNLQIPPFVKSEKWGLDGTGYEIYFGGLFTETTIRWWEDLPTKWNQLNPIVNELKELILKVRKEIDK